MSRASSRAVVSTDRENQPLTELHPTYMARAKIKAGTNANVLPAITNLRPENDRNFVTGLARGLTILLAFSDKRRHMSVAEISHRTAISRAAVGRSLHTLEHLGYVSKDERRHFCLQPRILSFAHAYLSGAQIVTSSQPVLDRLSNAVCEACALAVLDGDEVVYVSRAATSRILSPMLNVGSRLPAYCTSTGIVLLAYMPAPEQARYLARVSLHRYTERTVHTRAALRKILADAVHAGYATADQQLEKGVTSIAVPVRDTSGVVVAAMNILMLNDDIPVHEMQARFLRPLQDAAAEVGSALLT